MIDRAMHHFSTGVGNMTIAAGRSPVVVVLGLGLLIAIAVAASRVLSLPWGDYWLGLGLLALVLGCYFELVVRTAQRSRPVPVVPFYVLGLVAGISFRLLYVQLVEPEWYTDFLRYWSYGLQLASGELSGVGNIYAQRAFYLTRPLIEVFGESPSVVPVFNAIVLTLIQVLGYDILRRLRSHQAAQGFVLLWMCVPEPLMASAVPNHDLAGLLLICLAIWLWAVTWNRQAFDWRTILSWVAAGAVLALLEAARGLGTTFLLVLVLMAGAILVFNASASPRNIPRRALGIGAAVAVAGLTFFAGNGLLGAAGATVDASTQRHLMLRYTTPHATSLSNGSYDFMYAFEKAFLLELADDQDDYSEFRRSLVLSDYLSDPLRRIQASAAKMERQYALGSQQNFYLRGVAYPIPQGMYAANLFFVIFFSCFLLRSGYLLIRHRERQPSLDHFLLLFVASTSLILLVVGESQPRYLSALWLAGAVVIPSQLSFRDRQEPGGPSPIWLFVSGVAVLGLLLAVLWAAGSLFFGYTSGRILNDWSYSVGGTEPAAGREFLTGIQSRQSSVLLGRGDRPVPMEFGQLSLKLMLADVPAKAPHASAEHMVCGLDLTHELRFHYDFPAKRLKGQDAFLLQVLRDQTIVWSQSLPNAGAPAMAAVPLHTGDSECAVVTFRLLANNAHDRASWQRASFVEVFFPRIVSTSYSDGDLPGAAPRPILDQAK